MSSVFREKDVIVIMLSADEAMALLLAMDETGDEKLKAKLITAFSWVERANALAREFVALAKKRDADRLKQGLSAQTIRRLEQVKP